MSAFVGGAYGAGCSQGGVVRCDIVGDMVVVLCGAAGLCAAVC